MSNILDKTLVQLWVYRGVFWFFAVASAIYALVVNVYLGMRWIAFDLTDPAIAVAVAAEVWMAFYFSLCLLWRWHKRKVAAEIVEALDKADPDWPTRLEKNSELPN